MDCEKRNVRQVLHADRSAASGTTTAKYLKLAFVQVNPKTGYALCKLVVRQPAISVAVQMLQHVDKILTRVDNC